MTKRYGNFANTNGNGKKVKTNGNLDDLWGDDLDAKDIDDCFMLATQVWEQDDITCTQRNNVSILPPYNVFKGTSNALFTSTQSNGHLHFPSTSKVPVINGFSKQPAIKKNNAAVENGFKRTRSFESCETSPHLDPKLKKLQEECVAKEGEVSILRSQLKDVRASRESEQNKKHKEWTEKLAATTKQLTAVKSELEFKNLEIANLKQKVVEVAKLNNLDTSLNCTQSPFFKQPKVPEKLVKVTDTAITAVTCSKIHVKPFKIQSIVETRFPLQNAIPENIFAFAKEEKYLVDIKHNHMCRNTIPFLQNQISEEIINRLIHLQPTVSLLNDGRKLNFDYVYCEMSKLIKCDVQQIDSEENYACINKILCVSEQLLCNLYQFLQELERNTLVEKSPKVSVMHLESKLENLDLNQSLFDTKQWCDNEMGINVKQSIACISQILLHSSYLRGYLLQNKPLIFKENEEYLKYLPAIKPKLKMDYCNNYDYLHLLTSLITIIGKLKKSDRFPGVLSSIMLLLNNICLCSNIHQTHSVVHNIMREMIFCRPNIQVLLHFSEFLKNASLQDVFVTELCKMPPTTVLKVCDKGKVLYYNEETCVLQVLCVLLEDGSLRMDDSKIMELCLNLAKFFSNSIKSNSRWMFYQEEKHCDCLCKVVKLCVDVIYRTLGRFHYEGQTKLTDNLLCDSKILKNGLQIFEILYILNFKVYELIVKYVETVSQYKDIIKLLLDLRDTLHLSESDVELLEDINVADESPTGENQPVSNILLWNNV